ncbi:MAG TPA: hypothetical protein VF656_18985 [Pyrinomonadaceae bacterium]|jgi:hypothetical protein
MSSNHFTNGDATQIAYQCTIDITGSSRPLDPSAALSVYNVQTDQQIFLIKKDIRNNVEIGLPAYGRTIDLAALNEVSRDTKISELSDIIFDNSHTVVGPSFSARPYSRAHAEGVTDGGDVLSSYIRQNPLQAVLLSMSVSLVAGLLIGMSRR